MVLLTHLTLLTQECQYPNLRLEVSTVNGMPRLNVNLPDELHRRAKAQAALRGVSLREYVEQAIAAAVEADEKAR